MSKTPATPAGRALTGAAWLREQYGSSVNLSARAALHVRFRTNPYPWQRWVFDRIRTHHTARILEIGCGPGPLWRENRDRIPLGWRIWLADLSEGMCREAARGLRSVPVAEGERRLRYGEEYSVAVADAQQLPFAASAFDVVIANHMLYHVADIPACLAEIRRVLRRGGRFYAATNGPDHLAELHGLVRDFEGAAHQPDRREDFFGFEQGAATLPDYFGGVRLHRFPNSLRVTEPQPLVAYVLSGLLADPEPEKADRFRAFVVQRLAQIGELRITAQSGLFECIRM